MRGLGLIMYVYLTSIIGIVADISDMCGVDAAPLWYTKEPGTG